MPGLDQPLLINILGHAGGAMVFAIFLFLLYSPRGWSGLRGRYLPGLAAMLSMVWNLGSLVVLAWPGLPQPALGMVAALSFSVLSVLPAVLLHLSLGRGHRALVAVGYGLSGVAVVMHFADTFTNRAELHQAALTLITIGFLALTVWAVVPEALRGGGRGRPDGARILASMCLALFATSFVHFGGGHVNQAWSSELMVHHAGIPLALLLLLQDYRFILMDAFARFLANALLAAVLAALVTAAAFRLLLVERVTGSPLQQAVLLISVCLFLVFFAWLRNYVQAWLTRVVFRQGNVANLPAKIKAGPPFQKEEEFLDWAAATVAAAMKTKDHAVVNRKDLRAAGDLHLPALANALGDSEPAGEWSWVETIVPVRLGPESSRLMLLGRRHGGQRYLGEDLDTLARAAAEIAERVDSLRRQEMSRLVSQAELRALQSQINPHFLFNALNTLYGTIPREAGPARRMVLNLAEIFRYFLRSERTFVPLAEEMEIVRAYLEVEQLRLGERLKVDVRVEARALDIPIPALTVQPLVENAIKHGLARRTEPGYVRITGEIRGNALRILVENSGSSAPAEVGGAGVALENVKRRLEICYGTAARFRLDIQVEAASAELVIPVARAGVA